MDFLSRLTSCTLCPRLVQYRQSFPEGYWRKPVPPNGDISSKIVVVGLAPAGHGGNRTGRMFTGDRSANNLMWALHKAGLANKATSVSRDDGLVVEVYITSAVKCAPPQNKPTREEIVNCSTFLAEEITMMTKARVYIALGKIAWDTLVENFSSLGFEVERERFHHGAEVKVKGKGKEMWLLGSYHPSPRNVNTGRMTLDMLYNVVERARKLAEMR
ncbi:uracil-DNA glycosylase [Metallosphaera hakonensis]|nr:uracil-DNA glycosylase [Metallosphaera hakonensis]